MNGRVLVVEDDPVIRANVLELLSEEGFETLSAQDGADGIALTKARVPELVICDITLPKLDGYAVLRAIREDPAIASTPFIFLTAKAERADVRAGMNLGADDYLTKPFTARELLDAVRIRMRRISELLARGQAALEKASVVDEEVRSPAFAPADGVVVLDQRMRQLYELVQRAAASSINVLVLGETGVGKEVLARALHNLSPRKAGPFVALNCAALTESLLQSELFGHEKGAFTGALQARAGLLETAAGGTLFLDEIGDLPLSIQTKLLRVLEDKKVLRVGARAERAVDVRFVAATNRDIEADAQAGTFREDLFYRLNGISLTIPPLRERRAEIAALGRMFLARYNAELGREAVLSMSKEVVHLLESYHWPGNVRELRNAIERAAVLCSGDLLLPEHLPVRVVAGSAGRASSAPPGVENSREDILARARNELQGIERQRILDALEQSGGNQTRAAEVLGISRRTLVYRLSELGVPRPRRR
ncbi:MAG TPA: sigma-54 dependent transcriptional regulator [Polyangiaceae bacterium]|nr:sigma-54 dependent transcriptional regulator [Polyangiaceae bacterium]